MAAPQMYEANVVAEFYGFRRRLLRSPFKCESCLCLWSESLAGAMVLDGKRPQESLPSPVASLKVPGLGRSSGATDAAWILSRI